MFCPECGTLGFMEANGNIRCTNYTCGYEGPLAGKDGKGAEFTDPMTGETIDLSKASTSSETSSLRHLNEVVPVDVAQGTLWVGDYLCPKCDADRIFVVLMQTRSSDEPETKICTCESCGHKFREYQ
jgi:DNA-directed RNA polymerase subunit M|tara:strand:- start:149 stop:529 length:381 start_codon:yes stop_codon:yes gene_type:complete